MSEYEHLTDEERAGIALHLPDIKNSHTRQIVRYLLSDLTALRAELRDCQIGIEQRNDMLKRTENELDRMRKALEPFANCVFNDNGDLTIDQSHLHGGDWLRAYRALKPQPAKPEKS